MNSQDNHFMKVAIEEAEKGDLSVYPNPKVGALVVRKHKILSTGYHQNFGGEHAEVKAIKSLKTPVKNATLYVTLEPCAMCCGLLIHSRIENLIFVRRQNFCVDPF